MYRESKNMRAWRKGTGAGLLAGALLLGGCASNDESSGTQGASSSAPAASGTQSSAAEQPLLKVDWMNLPGLIQEHSYGQQVLESKFNIKLEKVYPISGNDFKQKQQLMVSTGDVPDVMIVMDPAELSKYAAQGLIAEVPVEMIEQYAPNTKKKLDQDAPQGWYYSNVGGKNYGLPTMYFNGQFHSKQVWRTDLLEKAGIAALPKTIDEMTQAFAALKKIGVYGMSSNGNSYYNQFPTIFGAFGIMPTQWSLKDGHVVNGATQPEAKAALAQLAEWHKAGYIEPEFVTGKDLGAKFNSGKFAYLDNALATATSEDDPSSLINAIHQVDPAGKIDFAELPTGPNGQSGGWAWGSAGNIWAFGKQLEKEPEKMQRILQIMDTIQNDEETWLALAWGEQGVHYDYVDPAVGAASGLNRIGVYTDMAKLQEAGIADPTNGATFWASQGNFELVEKYYNKDVLNIYKTGNKPMVDLFGKADLLPSSGKYWPDLIKLKTEAYVKIIMGQEPLSYFDAFVKEWNAKGGSQLEEEANALYSSLQNK
ncbi:extracellular solute-binding protein [Cohnella rhizosphaerae]|uniref:Extracellular solute-binding protein n=1 Tax=Cohnella rhizosphaerae TaxID=1457232 RepID=A0A9X4L059_9BACL|nr:extracellular solute-binding protein [Cohnella rhizosphaerae]MDG0814566.1 extracellular solute-binding protein [Cohnella rhizosphaerae]